MDGSEAVVVREQLSTLVEYFMETRGDLGAVKFYEVLAEKLSQAGQKVPAWSWRYVQGVQRGTIGPSEHFGRAVNALGAAMDDVPVLATYTVQVSVMAKPGTIIQGALVLGESRACQWPGCRVHFVPRVPWQKYCSMELHLAAERERKRMKVSD